MLFVGFVCFLSGDGYLGDIATDRRKILHDGTWRLVIVAFRRRIQILLLTYLHTYMSRALLLPFWGWSPKGPKIRNFGPSNREYLVNDKSQRYMSITAPRGGGSRRNIAMTFDVEKLECWGYPMVTKFEDTYNRFTQNTSV